MIGLERLVHCISCRGFLVEIAKRVCFAVEKLRNVRGNWELLPIFDIEQLHIVLVHKASSVFWGQVTV